MPTEAKKKTSDILTWNYFTARSITNERQFQVRGVILLLKLILKWKIDDKYFIVIIVAGAYEDITNGNQMPDMKDVIQDNALI